MSSQDLLGALVLLPPTLQSLIQIPLNHLLSAIVATMHTVIYILFVFSI